MRFIKKSTLPALALAFALTSGHAEADPIMTIGGYQLNAGGFLQLDYTDYNRFYDFGLDSDGKSIAGDGGSDIFFRHAHFHISGVSGDWKFMLEYDFEDDDGDEHDDGDDHGSGFDDAYLRYTGFGDLAHLSFGKFKTPFGLDNLTHENDLVAMHYDMLNQFFSPSYQYGAMLSGSGADFSYAIGVFDERKDSSGDIEPTFIARYTYAPQLHPGLTLHLGAALLQSDYASGSIGQIGASSTTVVIAKDKSTFSDIGFRPVQGDGAGNFGTYAFAYDGYRALSLEMGLSYGPWHARAEYMQVSYDKASSSARLNAEQARQGGYVAPVRPENCNAGAHTSSDFDGLSVLVAYALTGESRSYDIATGVFRRPRPASATGAWELFFRHATLDSDNKRALCDRLANTTYGVNWYMNENARLGLNFIQTDIGSRNQLGNESEGDAIGLSLQYSF